MPLYYDLDTDMKESPDGYHHISNVLNAKLNDK